MLCSIINSKLPAVCFLDDWILCDFPSLFVCAEDVLMRSAVNEREGSDLFLGLMEHILLDKIVV